MPAATLMLIGPHINGLSWARPRDAAMYCAAYESSYVAGVNLGRICLRARTRGGKGWYGWPCDPKLNPLRDAWATEIDPDESSCYLPSDSAAGGADGAVRSPW